MQDDKHPFSEQPVTRFAHCGYFGVPELLPICFLPFPPIVYMLNCCDLTHVLVYSLVTCFRNVCWLVSLALFPVRRPLYVCMLCRTKTHTPQIILTLVIRDTYMKLIDICVYTTVQSMT